MTDQNKSVETLQMDVDQVTADLAEAKKLTDEALKKAKAEEATVKAETTENQVKTAKEEANKKLEALKGKIDATSKIEITKLEAEIEKYEAMLVTLDSSKTELTILKSGVTTLPIITTPETKNEEPEEKKNRFKRQRDGFSDSTEEHHILKNTARIAGGIGVGVLVYKGIQRLFGGSKNKEENKEGEKTEEPGFWKTRFGKFLKWTGIGTGAYYVVHGLGTGRWNIKDFFDWSKKNELNPEDIADRYKNEVKEELKPKYEQFGTMVDEYHKGIQSGDSLGVMENKEGKEITIPKGCIPAALDKAYDNIGSMLNTSNYINEQWADTGLALRDRIKGVGKEVAGMLLKPFIGAINGLKKTMFGSDGKPNEEFDARAKNKDLDRDQQIGNLMQKYAMVTTYLGTKKDQLEREYAKKYLISTGNSSPTEEQITDALDDDKAEEYVKAKMETEFNSKKIVALKDEDSVLPVLQDNKIYNAEPSEGDKKIASEVEERKKEILKDPSLLEKCKASPNINQDNVLKAELLATTERFKEHLDKGIIQRNMFESMANCFGILNLDELWNGKNADIENMIEELGFNDEVATFKQETIDFKIKLVDGTATSKDIEAFEKTMNAYFDKEKQVLIKAEKKNQSEGGFLNNLWYWSKERGCKLIHTPGGRRIIAGGAVFGALYVKLKGFRNKVNVPTSWIKRGIGRQTRIPKLGGMNFHRKLGTYGKNPNNLNRLLDDFKAGKIDKDIAEGIFVRRIGNKDRNCGDKTFADMMGSKFGMIDEEGKKQLGSILNYTQNRNIRKLLQTGKYVELAKQLGEYKDKLLKLSGEKKILFENMFAKGNFKSIDDINNIVKNIDSVDDKLLSDLSPNQIRKLAENIGKDFSKFKTAEEINAAINEAKKGINAIDETIGATEEAITRNLASSRTVKGIPGELEAGGKLDKYNSFKKEYEDAHKLPTKAERDIKNAEIDKRLAKQLIKDGKKLEDIIKFTPDQKAVYDLVQQDMEEIKALKAGVSRKTGPTATTELAYKTKIKNMIAFERQLGEFTGEEISAFNSLNKLEFKTFHIIELLELRKTNPAIKNALVEGADVGEIVKTLRAQKSATVEISEGLMTAMEAVRIKSISKVGSEAAVDFARIILKLAGRILKI